MVRKNLLFSVKIFFTILSLLCANSALCQDADVFYTLEAVKYVNNKTYDGEFNVTINGLDWRAPGNQNLSNGWQIGGNELNKVDRTITGKSPIERAIGKVTLNHGGIGGKDFTVHSISLTVASDANFSNIIAIETNNSPSVSAEGSIDFMPASDSTWPAGSYYKLTIKCSNSNTTTNQYLIFKSLVFYEGQGEKAESLPAPTNLSASDITHSSATLTWNAVENAIGYKVKIGNTEHTVSTNAFLATDLDASTVYSWSVKSLGDGTAYASSEYATSETFETESIPTHCVTWSVNGSIITEQVAEGDAITFSVPTTNIPEGKTFVGWYTSPYAHADTAPAFVRSATMGAADVVYYAVFATKSTEETQEIKAQTLEYDTWTYRGSTQDKKTYRLFHTDSYVESEPFDLNLLTKVVVYGGYFGNSSSNILAIGDGTNIWKEVTVSGNDATKAHTYTGGTPLSGIGTLRVTSCSGTAASNRGVRISKIEIYTLPAAIYTDFCTSTQAVSYSTKTLDFVAHNGDGYWATFSSDQVTFFPLAVTPYVVSVEDGRMALHSGEEVFGQAASVSVSEGEQTGYYVPANVGVLLNSSEQAATYYTVTGRTATINAPSNRLKPGTGEETTGEGCKFYRLAYNNYAEQTGLGFYFGQECSDGEAFICKQGLAYLAVPEEVSVKGFVFGEDDSDGILAPFQEKNTKAQIFNLAGQRLLRSQRGINVVNGKKIVVE